MVDELTLRPIERGSGVVGRLATRGRVPLGYHKDPERSARTFVEIDGERWSLPGDMATIDTDGTIHLLGRGSMCINTGGEKVYPEEVEAVLKSHPDVGDAVVLGRPTSGSASASSRSSRPSPAARRPASTSCRTSAGRISPATRSRAACTSWTRSCAPPRGRPTTPGRVL